MTTDYCTADYMVELERLAQVRGHALGEVDKATNDIKALLPGAVGHGLSESEIAHYTGISRMTIRRWLGK